MPSKPTFFQNFFGHLTTVFGTSFPAWRQLVCARAFPPHAVTSRQTGRENWDKIMGNLAKQTWFKIPGVFFRNGSEKSWSQMESDLSNISRNPYAHTCVYTYIWIYTYLCALAFSTRWKLSKQNFMMFFSAVVCMLMLMKNIRCFPPSQKRVRTGYFSCLGKHCQLSSIYLQNS